MSPLRILRVEEVGNGPAHCSPANWLVFVSVDLLTSTSPTLAPSFSSSFLSRSLYTLHPVRFAVVVAVSFLAVFLPYTSILLVIGVCGRAVAGAGEVGERLSHCCTSVVPLSGDKTRLSHLSPLRPTPPLLGFSSRPFRSPFSPGHLLVSRRDHFSLRFYRFALTLPRFLAWLAARCLPAPFHRCFAAHSVG